MLRKILFALLLLLPAIKNYCQDTDVKERAYLSVLVNERLGGAADIYSGAEYVYPGYPKRGTPFFISDSLTPGWIVYDGHLYPTENLQWDIQQNFVLILAADGYSKIILRNDLVDSFSLAAHTIVKMNANPAANLQNADFYDLRYRGKTKVLVRRKKDTRSDMEETYMTYNYFPIDKYYINKKGTYYLVSNKREVLNVLSGHRNAINRQIKKAGLNWRRDFEEAVMLAATYYDELNH